MSDSVLLISIPKSGTNMLTQAIALGDLRGDHKQIHAVLDWKVKHPMPEVLKELREFHGFARGHIVYHEEYAQILINRKIKVIFLFRDPRDMIVSHKYWILRQEDVGGGFMNFNITPSLTLNKSPDIIGELIKVYPDHVRKFLPWMEHPDVFLLRYESLLANMEETFKKLIGWFPTPFKAASSSDSPEIMIKRINPNTCVTFRKGIIGEWKSEFTEEQKKEFWERSKDIMRILGYGEHSHCPYLE